MRTAFAVLALVVTGCANYDRDYQAGYDLDSQRGALSVTVRRAETGRQGSPSFSGSIYGGKSFLRPAWR